MAHKTRAFVMVQRSWFDETIGPVTSGRESQSTGNAHTIVGTLDDIADHRGLWLQDVPTLYRKQKDDSPVTFARLLIPWQYVLSLGLEDATTSAKIKPGFANTTDLTGSDTDQ